MADAENAETTPAAETPKEEEPESKDRSGPAVPPDDYVWPENLFIEMRDMAAVSFLVYAVGYVVDVARKTPLEGIEVTDENRVTLPNRELARSFAPGEVLEILEKNRPKLIEHYEEVFDENGTFWDLMIDNLKTMMERAESVGNPRALTLEEYDDQHQQYEMVYGITKDDVNKRIALVFRGTDNNLAALTNWTTNARAYKVKSEVPDLIKDVVNDLWIHGGFHAYVFDETKDETDAPGFRKFDEIMQDLLPLVKANPGYKVYTTGHSLGAALSTLIAFYLACDPEMPKPVTNLCFASPRVGNNDFLDASRWLEEKGYLRNCRVVNNKDYISVVPTIGYYHVGLQILLDRDPNSEVEVTYPKDSWSGWFYRMWQNSLLRNFNLRYDHGDYRERLLGQKDQLEKLDMNKLYKDSSLVGW